MEISFVTHMNSFDSVEDPSMEDTPAEYTPVEDTSVEGTLVDDTPAENAPVEDTPVAPPPADSLEKLQICVTMTDVNIIKGDPHESIRLGAGFLLGWACLLDG
jgi:hypothetical protein